MPLATPLGHPGPGCNTPDSQALKHSNQSNWVVMPLGYPTWLLLTLGAKTTDSEALSCTLSPGGHVACNPACCICAGQAINWPLCDWTPTVGSCLVKTPPPEQAQLQPQMQVATQTAVLALLLSHEPPSLFATVPQMLISTLLKLCHQSSLKCNLLQWLYQSHTSWLCLSRSRWQRLQHGAAEIGLLLFFM